MTLPRQSFKGVFKKRQNRVIKIIKAMPVRNRNNIIGEAM